MITLGIIGVIAALTMSVLIPKYQKQVTVNQLKKSYSIFTQAIEHSVEDNGPLDIWDLSLSGEEFTEMYIAPYLNIIKATTPQKENYYMLSLTKSESIFFNANSPMYVLNDGKLFLPLSHLHAGYSGAVLFLVDINGIKNPNIIGKDVFVFAIPQHSPRKFDLFSLKLMFGVNQTRDDILLPNSFGENCAKNNSYSGLSCGYLIMIDGWQIKNDYPW